MADKSSRPGQRVNLRVASRALLAVGLAALVALVVRLRGSGGTPPHRGGWREVSAGELGPPVGGPGAKSGPAENSK